MCLGVSVLVIINKTGKNLISLEESKIFKKRIKVLLL